MNLSRVAAGDESALKRLICDYQVAFSNIYWKFSKPSFREFYGYDDFVQDTSIRLWRSANKFDPKKGKEGNWVTTVARRTLIDAGRAFSCRMRWIVSSHGIDDAKSRDVGYDDGSLYQEIVRLVPEPYLHLVELRIRGLNDVQIATALDMSVGTVKSRLHKARVMAAKVRGSRGRQEGRSASSSGTDTRDRLAG